MVRIQLAPDIEFKMDVDLGDLDLKTRDYDVQQFKAKVYAEFERRLQLAFPEGFKIHTIEFGLDTGWHEELKDTGRDKDKDRPVIV